MIVIKYEEERFDAPTGAVTQVPLGTEQHQGIEEVLLPTSPSTAPIFCTKKFAGHTEYRWEVKAVRRDPAAASRTYIVTLTRRDQLDKRNYLQNILASSSSSGHVLQQWALVEVEFGHPLTVGKENGDIRSSKRYVDTIQRQSMPKRRLAIVTQAHPGRDELIQVIPISSQPPRSSDVTMVEVTSCLTDMVDYQKPSWAVCRMLQTVTASRIIAPVFRLSATVSFRDRLFRTKIRGKVREDLKDALMYGVAAGNRVTATQALNQANTENSVLKAASVTLTQQVADLEEKVRLYEKWAAYTEVNLDDLRTLYGA